MDNPERPRITMYGEDGNIELNHFNTYVSLFEVGDGDFDHVVHTDDKGRKGRIMVGQNFLQDLIEMEFPIDRKAFLDQETTDFFVEPEAAYIDEDWAHLDQEWPELGAAS